MGFALFQGGESTLTGDLYMVAAVLLCGLGYAEGARLSRPLGSWQVICWALVLSLPLMLILSITFLPVTFSGIPAQAWGGLIYVSLFSMLIGFSSGTVAWRKAVLPVSASYSCYNRFLGWCFPRGY